MKKAKKSPNKKNQQAMAGSEFCLAVAISDAGETCSPGLQAIESKDQVKISKPTGSLNLDKAKATSEPQSNRWDYGIGYFAEEEQVVWVEVHPASTGEVETMLKKLAWLKAWLEKDHQKQLNELTEKTRSKGIKPFVWVASGRVSILSHSAQFRALSTSGMKGPVRGDVLP